MKETDFRRKKTAFQRPSFALAALSLIILTMVGCYQIPTSKPNWGTGIGEYALDNEEMQEQWRRAASGPSAMTAEHGRTSIPREKSAPTKSKEESNRFGAMKKWFQKDTESAASEQKTVRSSDLYSEDRFYPADQIVPVTQTSNVQTIGKTVALTRPQTTAVPASTDNMAQDDLTGLIQTMNESSEQVTPSPVFFQKEAEKNVIRPVGYTETHPVLENSIPIQKPSKLAEACDEKISNSSAREIVLASPLAFLSESSDAAHPVTHFAANETNDSDADWRAPAERAIERLQAEIDRQKAAGKIDTSQEARLRLLLLSTGNISAATEEIAGISPELSDFWKKQCLGLGTLIESEEPTNGSAEPLTAAAGELSESLDVLKAACPIQIRKALFVENASTFGLYRERASAFRPGQRVFVYLELDNIADRKVADDRCIDVLCRWELLDSTQNAALPPHERLCSSRSASPLKDIVLNIPADLPETLAPGAYTLRVTVLDKNGARPAPCTRSMNMSVN